MHTNIKLCPRASGGKPLSLSPQERDDLHNLYRLTTNIANKLSNTKDGLPFLRAPLQLSLLVSPLYLLIPAQLHKKSYSRQHMLSMSEFLGNRKPDTLVAVENAIWRVVFALADGHLNPTELLKKLADDLPWGQISKLTSEDRCWFGICKPYHKMKFIIIYPALQAQIHQLPCRLACLRLFTRIQQMVPTNLMKTTCHLCLLCRSSRVVD